MLGGGNGATPLPPTSPSRATRSASGAATPQRSRRCSRRSITLKDSKGRRDVKHRAGTTDIGAVVRGAELLVVPVPAFAQLDIARAMAPHLSDGQVAVPAARNVRQLRHGHGASAMPAAAREVAFAETGTLPYLARKHGAREIAITIRAKRLPTGVVSGEAAARPRST